MILFEYIPEPLLLLVIGAASLLFGLVLHATRHDDESSEVENPAHAAVEISHSSAVRARTD